MSPPHARPRRVVRIAGPLLGVSMLGVGWLLLTLWPGPAASVSVARFEPAELGSQTGDALPLGKPLQGVFLVVGSGEDTSEVCVPARTADGLLACLFTTRLAGASHLEEGSTYRMVAVFESSRSTPTGRLLTAEPATIATAGPEVELPSRFAEQREALSTWLGANGLRGTLRSDGIHVWYLPEQTSGDPSTFADLGAPSPAWVSAIGG
jgi:hypothetical protein